MSCSRGEFLRGAIAALGGAQLVAAASAADATDARGGGRRGRLRIAHLTDPQFGFGQKFKTVAENYPVDLARFERAVEKVNALKPDLAVITGDMTHNAEDVVKDWPRLLKAFEVPVYVAPGNHDMGRHVTKENYERHLSVFGYDRKAFDVKGWRIIIGNTQFLFPTVLKDEQAAYHKWVEAELENAKKYEGRVILAGHYPPFVNGWNEKDGYENYPSGLRQDRMRMYRQKGAAFILAGHTHRFGIRGYKELTILNAEVTSNSFDSRPFGFRMFEIGDDMDYSYNFVGV